MLVKGNYVEKKDCVYITEDYSLEKALEVLKETGYRCIPVLDASKKSYVGNIYKAHILEASTKGTLKIPVSSLIKDSNEYIKESASFFEVFFTIKRLPYISVINDKGEFLGILTHAKVFEILEDSWGTKSGSYSMTIGTMEVTGALLRLVETINRHSSIQSLITLDNKSSYLRRIVLTLPKQVDEALLNKIVDDVENRGFRVIDIEKWD